ncbi:hypothetical protein ACFVP8_07645 [Viridibacillus arvi]|uniref:hypothetical protein n=1 Tax=Viridibacillus arvi TaxID=263475 RepID=UPI0036747943
MENKISEFKNFYNLTQQRYGEFFKNILEKMYKEKGINPFVFNENLEDIDLNKVKFILVGDNPGYEEQKVGQYLIGSAGQSARDFFKNASLINNFKDEVLVLNKTFLFTKRTKELDDIYYNSELKEEHRECMREIEKFMAQLVFDIHTDYPRVQPIIIGFAGCKSGDSWLRTTKDESNYLKNNTLPYFFEELIKLYNTNRLKKPLILKHFSFDHFSDQYNDLKNDEQTVLENLSRISEINSKGLFGESV